MSRNTPSGECADSHIYPTNIDPTIITEYESEKDLKAFAEPVAHIFFIYTPEMKYQMKFAHALISMERVVQDFMNITVHRPNKISCASTSLEEKAVCHILPARQAKKLTAPTR